MMRFGNAPAAGGPIFCKASTASSTTNDSSSLSALERAGTELLAEGPIARSWYAAFWRISALWLVNSLISLSSDRAWFVPSCADTAEHVVKATAAAQMSGCTEGRANLFIIAKIPLSMVNGKTSLCLRALRHGVLYWGR